MPVLLHDTVIQWCLDATDIFPKKIVPQNGCQPFCSAVQILKTSFPISISIYNFADLMHSCLHCKTNTYSQQSKELPLLLQSSLVVLSIFIKH